MSALEHEDEDNPIIEESEDYQPSEHTTESRYRWDDAQSVGSSSVASRLPCPAFELHATQWTNILLTHPPLATFTKRIAHRGFAMKRGPTARKLFNWQRVFLLLQYPFLSYFSSNDPSTKCRGVVYLGQQCEVRRLPFYPGMHHVLQLRPSVKRNLHHRSRDPDEDNFYFSFSDSATLTAWEVALLREIARGHSTDRLNEVVAVPPASPTAGRSDLAVLPSNNDAPPAVAAAVPSEHPVSLHEMDLENATAALRRLSTPVDGKFAVLGFAAAGPPDGGRDEVAERDRLDDDGGDGAATHAQVQLRRRQLSGAQQVEFDGDDERSASQQQQYSDPDRLSSRTSTSQSQSHRSSILPRFAAAEVRRKSFFCAQEIVDCFNSDHCHRTHCVRCKVSPVFGYLYTCVVCDACELCASCFRTEDHDPRHLFLVTPDVEGETARVGTSLEGGPIRLCELIVFEALFRLVGRDGDGNATRPLSKSRLCTFWNSVMAAGNGKDDYSSNKENRGNCAAVGVASARGYDTCSLALSERDLTLLCRDPELVTFAEFIFIARCKLGSVQTWHILQNLKDGNSSGVSQSNGTPMVDGSFALLRLAFSIVKLMLREHRSVGKVEDMGRGMVTSPMGRFVSEYNSKISKEPISEIEQSCLHMLMGACSVVPKGAVEEHVSVVLCQQLLFAMVSLTHMDAQERHEERPRDLAPVEERVRQIMAEEFYSQPVRMKQEDDEFLVPVSMAMEVVRQQWIRMRSAVCATTAAPSPFDHGLCEVVEHVLCYEIGGALGLYSSQLESIHAEVCCVCRCCPIVGFAYVSEGCAGASLAAAASGVPGNSVSDEPSFLCHSCVATGKFRAASSLPSSRGAAPVKSKFVRFPGGVSVTF